MRKSALKTLVKATIILAVFSLFLEINEKKIIDYLIFVLLWYILLSFYIYWKMLYKYEITDDRLVVKNPLRTFRSPYSEIIQCFYNQGFLQKKFGLYTVYIISRRGNVLIKDITNGMEIVQQINEKMNVFSSPTESDSHHNLRR